MLDSQEHPIARALMILQCINKAGENTTRRTGVDIRFLLDLIKTTSEKKIFLDQFQSVFENVGVWKPKLIELLCSDIAKARKIGDETYSAISKSKIGKLVVFIDYKHVVETIFFLSKFARHSADQPITVLIPSLRKTRNSEISRKWREGIGDLVDYLEKELIGKNKIRSSISSFIEIKFISDHLSRKSSVDDKILAISSDKQFEKYFLDLNTPRTFLFNDFTTYLDSPAKDPVIFRRQATGIFESPAVLIGTSDIGAKRQTSTSNLRLRDRADIFLGMPAQNFKTNSVKVSNFSNAIHHELRFENCSNSQASVFRESGDKFFLSHGDILLSAFYKRTEMETHRHPMVVINLKKKDLNEQLPELGSRDIYPVPANANVIVVRPQKKVRPWVLFLMIKFIFEEQSRSPLLVAGTTQARVLVATLEELVLPADPREIKHPSEKRLFHINKLEQIARDLDLHDQELMEKWRRK